MIEKVTHIAQQTATIVSRRQFLGRLGRGAAASAAALAGLLALPSVTHAGKRVQICSEHSGSCSGLSVGSGCGQGGTCKPLKRQKGRGKSSIVDCFCRGGNFGH